MLSFVFYFSSAWSNAVLIPWSFMLSGEKSVVIWIRVSSYNNVPFLTNFFQNFGLSSEIYLWYTLAWIYWGLLFWGSAYILDSVSLCLLSHLVHFHYYFLEYLFLVPLPLCCLLGFQFTSIRCFYCPIIPELYSFGGFFALFCLFSVWLNVFILKFTNTFICLLHTTDQPSKQFFILVIILSSTISFWFFS